MGKIENTQKKFQQLIVNNANECTANNNELKTHQDNVDNDQNDADMNVDDGHSSNNMAIH